MAVDAEAAPDCARLDTKHLRELVGAERPSRARREDFLQGGKGLFAQFLGGVLVFGHNTSLELADTIKSSY